jgi:molybdenum cofactor cytidylyltransferase
LKFGPVPLEEAEGKILGHNVANRDGRRVLRKGKPLTAGHLALLRQLGYSAVYVAELEPGDVDENAAARRVAQAVAGPHIRLSGPATGRVNLLATAMGLLRVQVEALVRLNAIPDITLASLPAHSAVARGKMVATIKIIPYAVPQQQVAAVEAIAAETGSLIHLDELRPCRVAVILSGSAPAETRIRHSFDPPLRARLAALGATIQTIDFIPLEDDRGERALADRLQQQAAAGIGLIILAGETAIMDRRDIAPRAVERAGGEVTAFGAPVDPGNLLMLAYLHGTPILGAPGCVRSPKSNVIDQVLPRLLAGDRLIQADIIALGHGGLLEDVPERPWPRSRLEG